MSLIRLNYSIGEAPSKIGKLQDALAQMPQHPGFETTHRFADGMYSREIEIPPAVAIISKTHAKECFFILLSGDLTISTDTSVTHLEAGDVFLSPPGKRAVVSVNGCRALTVHRLDPYTENLDEIEAQLVIPEDCSNYDFDNQLKDPALAAPDDKFLE